MSSLVVRSTKRSRIFGRRTEVLAKRTNGEIVDAAKTPRLRHTREGRWKWRWVVMLEWLIIVIVITIICVYIGGSPRSHTRSRVL